MPPLLDWLKGKDKEEEKPKAAPQRVSEEAARKRREELAREKKKIEDARKRFEEQEKKRLEAEKKTTERARPRVHQILADKKAAEKAKRTYVVKSGDSLSKIAKQVYEDAKRWPEIYEANKELIGDNPNLIKPGQKLISP